MSSGGGFFDGAVVVAIGLTSVNADAVAAAGLLPWDMLLAIFLISSFAFVDDFLGPLSSWTAVIFVKNFAL